MEKFFQLGAKFFLSPYGGGLGLGVGLYFRNGGRRRFAPQHPITLPAEEDLDLARAVVPPPRLRAKCVVFSAYLPPAQTGSGWGLCTRMWGGKSLQIPARVGQMQRVVRTKPCGDFERRLGKRVSF
jgi:hypothetical protein